MYKILALNKMLVHRQRKYLKELFKTSKIRRVSNIKDKSLFFECQLNQKRSLLQLNTELYNLRSSHTPDAW